MTDSLPPYPHPAALPVEALLADCGLHFTRRSGPGGQNRNKVETAVILTHRPSGISAEANERRSQQENRQQAVQRLRVRLAVEVRGTPESSGPSGLWQSRCRGGKLAVSSAHEDFPALLAEALDALWRAEFEPRSAALALGCTPSQLVKFVQQEPAAMQRLNAERTARNLHRLK